MNDLLPQHIAIIMDGNGRWAEHRGLARVEGHIVGVETVKKTIRCCLNKKIPFLSLFAFSSENWARPEEEVQFLLGLFIDVLHKELDELHQLGICLRFTGDRTPLPRALQQQMHTAEEVTQNNKELTVIVGINYGGQWDLVAAAKKMTTAVMRGVLSLEEVNEDVFAGFLDTHELPDPDLLIRTSGELRISNFYLWQLAYTEFYFTESYWPDFNEQAFDLALKAFCQRKRRYGRVD